MKQLLKKHKLSEQLLLFSIAGFIFSLGLSLIRGTLEFNRYCVQAMAGDWSGALYFGPEYSGFAGCSLNTLTTDLWLLAFGLYSSLFLIHVYLIFRIKDVSVKNYVLYLAGIAIIYLGLFYLTTGLFPLMSHGFLEGWVNVRKGRFLPPPLEGILVIGIISQLAPVITAHLVKSDKFPLKVTKEKKSFLILVLSVAISQLIIFSLAFRILIFWNRYTHPVRPLPDLTAKKQRVVGQLKPLVETKPTHIEFINVVCGEPKLSPDGKYSAYLQVDKEMIRGMEHPENACQNIWKSLWVIETVSGGGDGERREIFPSEKGIFSFEWKTNSIIGYKAHCGSACELYGEVNVETGKIVKEEVKTFP